MNSLILVLKQADRETLGTVRCFPGLEAADIDGFTWIRGIPSGTVTDIHIRQLPAVHTYRINHDQYLFLPGALTPVMKLPALDWQPLTTYISVSMPASALPGTVNDTLPVHLKPSGVIEKANLLLTGLDNWKHYALKAPLTRLKALEFAVDDGNRVLVLGTPLPPIPGQEFILQGIIARPAGFDFDPPVLIQLLQKKYTGRNNELLLFHADGSLEFVPRQAFVPAIRSAIRLTKGEIDGQ